MFYTTNMTKEKAKKSAVAALVLAGAIAISGIIGSSNDKIEPISFNGSEINFSYTDDNAGEDLIIYTDQKNYVSWDSAYVYFAVKNTSATDQLIKIQFAYENGGQTSKVEEFIDDVPYQITVNDYSKEKVCKVLIPPGAKEEKEVCAYEIIGTHEETEYKDEWGALEKKQPEDLKYLDQKTVPSKVTAKDQTNYSIPSGQTRYFRSKISFTQKSSGEFFINAYGSNGGYGSLDPSWYGSAGWLYRKTITIDHTKVPTADQTNFPVDVDITDANLASFAQSDGDDILFTSVDGTTKLDHEIEIYTSATGRLTAWVRVPTLSTSVDTVLYMYYGNAAASNQQNVNGTWNSGYLGVWHLKDGTTLSLTDSTSNGLTLTNNGTVTATVGKIDGGSAMGVGKSLTRASFASPANISVEAWGSASDISAGHGKMLVSMQPNNGNFTLDNWQLTIASDSDAPPRFLIFSGGSVAATNSSGSAVSLNTFYHIVGTYNGTDLKLYVNGTAYTTSPGVTINTNTASLYLADLEGDPGTYALPGTLDEVRISNTARAADWVTTEYNNQNATSTFYTIGTQENEPTGTPATYRVIIDGSYKVILPGEDKLLIQ